MTTANQVNPQDKRGYIVTNYAQKLCDKYSRSALLEIAQALEADAIAIQCNAIANQKALGIQGYLTHTKDRYAFSDAAFYLRTIAEHAYSGK